MALAVFWLFHAFESLLSPFPAPRAAKSASQLVSDITRAAEANTANNVLVSDLEIKVNNEIISTDVISAYSIKEELKRIIRDYGEEKFAGRIASFICAAREKEMIKTTTELSKIISEAIPMAQRMKEAQNPARRTFQAIRIEVNGELDAIEPSITEVTERLNPDGRLAVITFHSLEDRITKETFKKLSTGCTCPPEFPVCVCGKKPKIELLSHKPILPSERETEENPRSRSAKLRTAKKL